MVVGGSFQRLLGLGAVLYVCLPLTGVAALFRLRAQPTELTQPTTFRAWAFPLPPLLVAAVSLAFLAGEVVTRPLDCLLALMMVATGIPFLWRQAKAASPTDA